MQHRFDKGSFSCSLMCNQGDITNALGVCFLHSDLCYALENAVFRLFTGSIARIIRILLESRLLSTLSQDFVSTMFRLMYQIETTVIIFGYLAR